MIKNKVTLKATQSRNSPCTGVDGRGGGFGSLLFIFSLLLGSCGDSPSTDINGNSDRSWEKIALANTPATYQAVADASPRKSCPHASVFLASDTSSWRTSATGYVFNDEDTLEIRENCTFHSFACGTLGYLISGGEDFASGIASFMLLGHLFPTVPGCLSLGEQQCAYLQQNTGYLKLTCKLVTPLEKAFTP